MVAKILAWFEELSPVQRIAAGGVVGAGAGALVFLEWGAWVLLYAFLIVLFVVLALWGLNLFLKVRARKRGESFDGALIDDIRKAKTEIGVQVEKALQKLREYRVNVYELPWYLFVGEPRGGKTFTIRRSGVDLPFGEQKITGVSGTEDCDFWFTNEAVILDTAGRLTVQDDKVIDREQWNEFLQLLARYRGNCPINGVLLGIPCTSLLQEDSATREETAVRIRDRLSELQEELKVRFPVFVVILKTDLVLGFESFFRRLPVLERNQLFGWSNEARFDAPFDASAFDGAFDTICQNLHRWRLKFLNEENSTENVEQFYVFPDEFRGLKGPIREYLDRIFIRGPFGQVGFFRGLFFTSSLQEGKAIPLAIKNLLGGIEDRVASPSGDSQKIESIPFFIRDFYTKKVFREKGLLLRTERSRFVNSVIRESARWGGAALIAIALLVLGWRYWVVSDELAKPLEDVKKIERTAEKLDAETLATLKEIGERINEWEREGEGLSMWGAPYRAFFPTPAKDRDLLEDLKAIYSHWLREKHLQPFAARVLDLVQKGCGGGAETGESVAGVKPEDWRDFLERKDRLVDLVRDAAGEPTGAAARFAEQVALYTRCANAPALPEDHLRLLSAEYERFLEFGGDPSTIRPKGDDTWAELKTSADTLTAFLHDALDPSKVTDDTDAARSEFDRVYEDGIGELTWWRELFFRCHELGRSYAAFLEKFVTLERDGSLRVPRVATSSEFENNLKKPWKDVFGELANRVALLKEHLANPPGESLSRSLEKQKGVVEGFYQSLAMILAGVEGAKEWKAEIEKQEGDLLKRFDAFETEMETGRAALSYLVAGAGSDEPAKEMALSLEAGNIWGRLETLDAMIRGDPGNVHQWKTIKKSQIPSEIQRRYEEDRDKVKAPLSVAEAHEADWRKPELDEVLDMAARGALTNTVRGALKKYHDEAAGGKIDEWFIDETRKETQVGSSLLGKAELDPSYVKECHDRVREQIEALQEFVTAGGPEREVGDEAPEEGAPKTYLLLSPEDPEVKALENLLLGYQKKYLEYWKRLTESVRFSFEQVDDKTWADFRQSLTEGFGGPRPGGVFKSHQPLDDLKRTIDLVRNHVGVIPVEVRKADHPWAAALDIVYPDDTKVETLIERLKQFKGFVDKHEKPVEALKAVRADPSAWLEEGDASDLADDSDDRVLVEKEYFRTELVELARQGKQILKASAGRALDEDWKGLAARYESWVKERFPFVGQEQISDCETLLGEDDRQVKPSHFRTLLGANGEIRKLHGKYKDCFADAKEPYGLDGRFLSYEKFFRACESLGDFVYESTTDTPRKVTFQFRLLPEKDKPDLGPGREAIYNKHAWFSFAVGRDSRRFLNWGYSEASNEYSWLFPTSDVSSQSVSYAVLAGERTEQVVELRPRDPDAETCPPREPDSQRMRLELRTGGPWSLLLLLNAYGQPVTTDRREWLVEKVFQTDEADYVAYFRIVLDKPLEELPDWSEVQSVPGQR